MNSSIPYNDNPINILHIVNDRSVLAGGVGSVALEMLKEQRKLGNNAAIWSIDSTEEHNQTVSQSILEGQPDLTIFRTLGTRLFGYSPAMEKSAVSIKRSNFRSSNRY